MSSSSQRSLRLLAEWLARRVSAFLAPGEQQWAQAAEAELFAIDSDREALQWAASCLAGVYARQVGAQLKRPTAFLPLLMSLTGIAMVVGHVMAYGIVRQADEGTPAHIFQLLMLAQAPLVAAFALRRLPEAPAAAMNVLLLQAAAGCFAIAAVLVLDVANNARSVRFSAAPFP